MSKKTKTDELEFIIDPEKIRLSKLLEAAELSSRGHVTIRGDLADGTTQWGTIVVFGPRAKIMMDKIEQTLNLDALELIQLNNQHGEGDHN